MTARHDDLIECARRVATAAQIIEDLRQRLTMPGLAGSLRDCVATLTLLELTLIEQAIGSLCVPRQSNVVVFPDAGQPS